MATDPFPLIILHISIPCFYITSEEPRWQYLTRSISRLKKAIEDGKKKGMQKMDNVFDQSSEESTSTAGCESGWTLYKQHSIPLDNVHDHHQQDDEKDYDDDDDDDMSMVSDASSGPPHFQAEEHDEEEYCNDDINNQNVGVFSDPALVSGSRKRRKILKQNSHRHIMQDLGVSLDDTASSPFFNFYNHKDLTVCNNEASMLDDDNYSQGHSTTYFELLKHTRNTYWFHSFTQIGGDSNEYTDADIDDIREEWTIYVSNFIFR